MTAGTARRILRRQGMPPEEIRAVLAPGDPVIARRLLELHRERLSEWVEEQRRLLARIKRLVDQRVPTNPAPLSNDRTADVVRTEP